MCEAAVELTFSPETQSQIKTEWDKYVVGERLVAIGFDRLCRASFILVVCTSMALVHLQRRVA